MSNAKVHAVVGTGCGLGASMYRARHQGVLGFLSESVGGGFGGFVGGKIPDLIEPASHPNHRGVAHSLTVGGGTVLAFARAPSWEQRLRDAANRMRNERLETEGVGRSMLLWLAEVFLRVLTGFLTGLGAGYVSHLALDGCTPRGLPVLAR